MADTARRTPHIRDVDVTGISGTGIVADGARALAVDCLTASFVAS